MTNGLTWILLWAVLWIGCTQSAAAQDALDQIRQRGVLVWGADQEGGGPFVYPDPSNPDLRVGFEVDLADYLAKALGVTAEFKQGQWDKLPDLLDRGDIDIVLNGYEWTPSRAARFGTSIPYYVFELQLVGRTNDDTLRTWQDVLQPPAGKKKRIAVLGGSAAQDYLDQNFADQVDVISYDGATDALRGVELGLDGLDANLQDLPVWTFFQQGFPQLHAIDQAVPGGYYVVLTRKSDERLLAEINSAVLLGLQDGSLRSIFAKYRMWNATQTARGLEVDQQGGFVGDQASLVPEANAADGVEDFRAVRGWEVVKQRGWLLVRAASMTALLSVIAMPLAITIGLIMTLTRLFGPRWLSWLAVAYIELVRGTPLVLQLYVIFFLLPEIGISVSAFVAAILGLAINYSAYEAEIYRAGIQSIPKGQWEAATALGMSRNLTIRRIIVPQATRLVIPPMTNDFIALFKDTAVCSVITVVELSKEYYIHARSTGAIVELGLVTAVLYLAMSYPLSIVAARLERRLQRERRS